MKLAPLLLVASFALTSCATTFSGTPTDGPQAGQVVRFFPSMASKVNESQWLLQIQGRIYEPAEASQFRQGLVKAFALRVHPSGDPEIYRRRAGLFLSDSQGNAVVTVEIGGKSVRLPPSDAAGYFSGKVLMTDAEAKSFAKEGVITFESLPAGGNQERFTGTVVLVPDKGLTVVTDMDDTIKQTCVLDRDKMLANTFSNEFRDVPGMADLYRSWETTYGPGIHFHVVSAGPWQLNEPLAEFVIAKNFPVFTWDMRSIDIPNIQAGLQELTDQSKDRIRDFKIEKIRALMQRFPDRHVILVGDSAERDPEAYQQIRSEFENRVDAIYIRKVPEECQKEDRRDYASLPLRLFSDPAELPRSAPNRDGRGIAETGRW
ncbi:phosphatidate phosphatase App1 family protein [Cupriavidus lacunae]|nr:phosphatase domain-containing protein [Cupriavidus lacunae]